MSGTSFRNTDAYTDVGSRKCMEQFFEKTEEIKKINDVHGRTNAAITWSKGAV